MHWPDHWFVRAVGVVGNAQSKRSVERQRGVHDWDLRRFRCDQAPRDAHHDRPQFAFLNYLDVHDPYAAPPPFDAHLPENSNESALLRFWWFARRDSVTSSEKSLARQAYADCLRYLDHEIGRLLDELDARGRLDRTLIIENLKLTVEERLRQLVSMQRFAAEVRRAGRAGFGY